MTQPDDLIEPTEADADTTDPDDDSVDWKAEAAHWKAQSRKHEDRAKANAHAARELETTRGELATMKAADLDRVRREIATSAGIPASMMDRLHGDTAEELAADARAMAAELNRGSRRAVADLKSAALPGGDSRVATPISRRVGGGQDARPQIALR